ncbi:transketolase [Nocardia takedensis]
MIARRGGIRDDLIAIGQLAPDLPLPKQIEQLSSIARWVRRTCLRQSHAMNAGHLGSEFSVTDILVTLYCSVMKLPLSARTCDRAADRLILSKGHAAVALYATLVAAGVLETSRLNGLGGNLPGHPVSWLVPGVDATTGSLGHGLSVGVGLALAAKMDQSGSRTFVVLGDGELQEGSNWEAIMLAAHQRLGNLTAVIDANRLQQGTWVSSTNDLEPLRSKFDAFGWRCRTVDGHNFADLISAFAIEPGEMEERPGVVIATTIKGFGVSFMMNEPSWHHRIPTDLELFHGLEELDD